MVFRLTSARPSMLRSHIETTLYRIIPKTSDSLGREQRCADLIREKVSVEVSYDRKGLYKTLTIEDLQIFNSFPNPDIFDGHLKFV